MRRFHGQIRIPSLRITLLAPQVQSSFHAGMRKAALLYNPDSGGSGAKRLKKLESALGVLRGAGVQADLVASKSRDSAGELARQAMDAGCDTIFACGGDGTMHNVAQALANTSAALGVLPMGTANALAHDLELPRDLAAAATVLLKATPRRIALGHVKYVGLQGSIDSRYFVITAGVGVDAHLFYKLLTGAKQRMGMAAYYAKAWHMWFTYPMTRFQASYCDVDSQGPCPQSKSAALTELLAVRIRNFGGLLREFAPGASLERDDMRLIVCHTEKRLWYLSYVTRCLLGGGWRVPGIELVHSKKVSCQYQATSSVTGQRIYVEADGELLGTLPAEITVVPNALTLLVPQR
jgi:diacylglycerol kinase (ATP)